MKELQIYNGTVLVDDDKFEYLSQWNWHVNCNGYACRTTPRPKQMKHFMHRELSYCPEGMDVDHINGNRLDNRTENLRVCTRAQNLRNSKSIQNRKNRTSIYKGVSCRKSRWRARIYIDNKQIVIGWFDTEIQAAFAYDEAAMEHFGEYARLNFYGIEV